MRSPFRIGAFVLAISLCLTLGCGGGQTEVKGKVTYLGKVVVWGTVTLVDSTGMTHQGSIDLSGNYTIPKVHVGPVKIAVHSNNPEGVKGRSKDGGKGAAAISGKPASVEDPRNKFKSTPLPEPPRPEPGKWFPLPPKYADPNTSGLAGDVRSGQPLDIDIK